jgi:hypothetical protein
MRRPYGCCGCKVPPEPAGGRRVRRGVIQIPKSSFRPLGSGSPPRGTTLARALPRCVMMTSVPRSTASRSRAAWVRRSFAEISTVRLPLECFLDSGHSGPVRIKPVEPTPFGAAPWQFPSPPSSSDSCNRRTLQSQVCLAIVDKRTQEPTKVNTAWVNGVRSAGGRVLRSWIRSGDRSNWLA